MRLRHHADEPPSGWRDVAVRHVAVWAVLDDTDRAIAGDLAVELLGSVRWEAARGFALSDEMRVVIAVLAAVPALELGLDALRQVRHVIVHPTTMVQTGTHAGPVAGVVSDEPQALLGQAHHWSGPVLLAWDAVAADAATLGTGSNVVWHELAHKIDMLDGVVDGTPPIEDRALLDRWVAVCTQELASVRRGEPGPLRPYAGTSPGELFAVATETFFDAPLALRAGRPALYDLLTRFYRQDPARRVGG